MRPLQGDGNLNHGLVGLDRDKRLIGHHVIALVNVPGDDLRLFEAFTEIRQDELTHGSSAKFS